MLTKQPVKIISRKVTQDRTSLSPREQKRREEQGRFPRVVRLGVGRNARVGHVEAEIEQWIADRIAQRDRALAELNAEPPSASPGQSQ